MAPRPICRWPRLIFSSFWTAGVRANDDAEKIRERLGDYFSGLRDGIWAANIYLTHSGAVKVLDFGLARVRDVQNERSKTRTGTIIGTASFMISDGWNLTMPMSSHHCAPLPTSPITRTSTMKGPIRFIASAM